MNKLPLTVACGPYDRVSPLIDGRVAIEGCAVNFFPIPPEELFPRVYDTQDFDVTELSASSHILTSVRGEAPYIAIPVFLSRVFRHADIYIRTDRGIKSPEDLRGKRIGVPEYQMTAALWARGILSDEYGVKTEEIIWRNGGQEKPGRHERTPITLPPQIDLKAIPPDATLNGMFEAGELDGMISAVTPSCVLRGAPNVARLFADPRATEEAYYKKTGMFPIMHLVGIRRGLAEAHPWLPGSIFKAFFQARQVALKQLAGTGVFSTMLPWLRDDLARAQAVMGPDMWPYGINPNRKEIEAMTRWSVEQGLSSRAARIDEIFAPGFESPLWDTAHSL